MKKQWLILTALFGLAAVSCNKDDKKDPDPEVKTESYTIGTTEYSINHDNKTVSIKDKGDGTGTKTFYADTTYILDGMVFVNSGSTLTIEPGTVIKGESGAAENASALIVARGAKIMAEGTAEKPIIFTAVSDNLDKNLALSEKGLWGGVIILGNAQLNTTPNKLNVEGIPTSEVRGEYGGNNDADNSGVLKYVSIRHGGTNIGADNEINGLSLGGVGSGTTIDYIEIIANQDDGIEFFGGTVNVKHAIVAYCGDDSFDWDQGYRGKGQFWFGVQAAELPSDRLGELDGADDPEDGTPFGGGTVYNATLIGAGPDAGKKTLTFRANGGGSFVNCLFVNQAKGIDIQLKADPQDSYKQLVDGNLDIKYNVFDRVADESSLVKIGVDKDKNEVPLVADSVVNVAKAYLKTYLSTASNKVASSGVVAELSSLNPVPTGGVDNVTSNPGGFFDAANYNGAFEPNGTNWAQGWTRLFGN